MADQIRIAAGHFVNDLVLVMIRRRGRRCEFMTSRKREEREIREVRKLFPSNTIKRSPSKSSNWTSELGFDRDSRSSRKTESRSSTIVE